MPSPRKLLIYTHSLSGGGAERVCAALASGFARQGDHVILALDFEAPANSGYVDAGVRQVQLGQGHLANVLALARLLRSEMPDIALSALSVSNLKLAAAALLAGRLNRTILSYHGYADNEPQLLSQMSYWLTPALTRITAATVCVSDSLCGYLMRRWRASRRRTLRIYNPAVTWKAAAFRDPAAPLVLAVGRLNSVKNFTGLVRAFALLRHGGARLRILGEGSERGAIEAEIARLGLRDRVSLPGYVSEPWLAYGEASCLAVSSQTETFSLVVVEALANGVPVVTTSCKGPEEILDHGRFGQIVPFDDAPAMAAAIDAALDNRGSEAARISRAREFSLEAGLGNYGRLFDEVIARHAQPDPGVSRVSPAR